MTKDSKAAKPARTKAGTTKKAVVDPKASAPPAPKPEPSAAEREAITRATVRLSERPRRVALRTEKIQGKLAEIGPSHSDHAGWLARLQNAFDTTSHEFACGELAGIATALASPGQETADDGRLNAALAVVDGIEPRNEVEAMLASQMAVTHALALDFLGRTKRAETWKAFDCAGTMATKLQRTFIAQVEALARLRRGGEQKVTVEHVHVHPGGQAIVGNVQHPGGGDQK